MNLPCRASCFFFITSACKIGWLKSVSLSGLMRAYSHRLALYVTLKHLSNAQIRGVSFEQAVSQCENNRYYKNETGQILQTVTLKSVKVTRFSKATHSNSDTK